MFKPKPKTLIHVGCGQIDQPGWINVDARGFPHVHVIACDLTNLSQLKSRCADLIYMSHVLEHIRINDVPKVLKEMRRILKKGGILRLSVPDFDLLIDIYRDQEFNIKAIHKPLMGGQDFTFNFHKGIFNYSYLCWLMRLANYEHIRYWEPDKVEDYDFDDWASRKLTINGREYAVSLNLEGVK